MKNIIMILGFLTLMSCKTNNDKIHSFQKSPQTNEYILISSKIDSLELIGLNSDELRILRNEIFARYGYIFKSEDLKVLFSKYDWYKPSLDIDEINNVLTDIDIHNINLIKSIEKQLNCNCCKLIEINDSSDFINISGNRFRIELDKEILERNFEFISRQFYNKYLNDKNSFSEWGNNKNEKLEIKHKLYGKIEDENICKFLILETLYWDNIEGSLFLILIDQQGNLIDKYLISQYFDYAGGRFRIKTDFDKNEMNIYYIDTEIIDQDGEKYKYHYDSIATFYEFKNHNYVLLNSDTTKGEYWKN